MTEFDRTTTLVADSHDPDVLHADLDAGWASLRGIHGGYLAALAVRAVEPRLEERVVRTLSTSFLRPAAIGPARLRVETIRTGRNLTTFAVELEQDERPVSTTRIT